MSPSPLGERNRQSGRTTSHIDSHTMGDHEDEIPELSSPPHEVGEEDPTPIYDPSPDIPSHFSYDPSFTGRWYWFPGDETHHEHVSTSNVRYDILDIPKSDPAYHVESKFDPRTMPRGTPTLFHAERFGALVTLHFPSQWWRIFHMLLLGLVLVIIFRYQELGTPLTFLHMSLHPQTLFL